MDKEIVSIVSEDELLILSCNTIDSRNFPIEVIIKDGSSHSMPLTTEELDHLIQSLIYFRIKIDKPFSKNLSIHTPYNMFYE